MSAEWTDLKKKSELWAMSYGSEKSPLGFLITVNTEYYQKIVCLPRMFSEQNQPKKQKALQRLKKKKHWHLTFSQSVNLKSFRKFKTLLRCGSSHSKTESEIQMMNGTLVICISLWL